MDEIRLKITNKKAFEYLLKDSHYCPGEFLEDMPEGNGKNLRIYCSRFESCEDCWDFVFDKIYASEVE